jgi:hypothetical protein
MVHGRVAKCVRVFDDLGTELTSFDEIRGCDGVCLIVADGEVCKGGSIEDNFFYFFDSNKFQRNHNVFSRTAPSPGGGWTTRKSFSATRSIWV